MKKIILVSLIYCITMNVFSQVQLIITSKEGKLIFGDYKSKTADSLTILIKKKEMTMSYNEISKVQTMGVHFIQDAYTNTLSQNLKVLEYDKVCSWEGWGIYVSTRSNDSNVVLLFKFKWLIHNDNVPIWNVITDDENVSLSLSDGTNMNLALTNSYILQGYEFYNFGYAILKKVEINQLINSPIKSIKYRGESSDSLDEYAIMRQLFAIFDENGQWQTFTL